MALLTFEDLSLEIAYRDFLHGWVYYDIWFRWRGESVINDAILKRHNDHWARRGKGAVTACEASGCGILPMLRTVLETDKSDYWEGTDPHVLFAVYRGHCFPFLPSKWINLKREAGLAKNPEYKHSRPLQDNLAEILMFVDVYNFQGATMYYGDGLCFRMTMQITALRRFYEDLRQEYLLFRDFNKIDEFNRERFEEDWREEWF